MRLALLTCLTFISLLLTGAALAAPVAQPLDVRITQFNVPVQSVGRAELDAGTVRLPVSWSVQNRPISANLYFEQLLPASGTWVNVELPRSWEWVSSAGDGVVAPQPVAEAVIRLRLAVRDRSDGTTYAVAEQTVGITSGGAVTINYFRTAALEVRRADLDARVRVPVSWSVQNRPQTANLYFEQFDPEAEMWVNVELPRPWFFVSSAGDGLVALVPMPPDETTLWLRLIVRDITTQHPLGERQIALQIVEGAGPEPSITRFSTDAASVDPIALQNRTARVPVTWAVRDRPTESSLLFVQVMPDGSRRSVELPRPDPYVASEGTGLAAPFYPGDDVDSITLELRLMTLPESLTIDTAQIVLPLDGRDGPPDAAACEHTWFAQPVGDAGCPASAPVTTNAAYQPFERGYMVWFEGTIWVVGNNNLGLVLSDAWDGSPITYPDLPPEGLHRPINGFGIAWTQNDLVREILGWGTAPEQGFRMQRQSGETLTQDGLVQPLTVATLPDGTTITVRYSGSGSLSVAR